MKLYLRKKPKNLLQLVHKLIIQKKATYLKEGGKSKHTDSGRWRSRKDLRNTVRTYFPDITNKELNKLIKKMSERGIIYSDHCPDIGRLVLYPRFAFDIKFKNFKKLLDEPDTENSELNKQN